MHKYFICGYYGVMIFGSNEIGPVNELEMIVISFGLLFSILINTMITGEIITLVWKYN